MLFLSILLMIRFAHRKTQLVDSQLSTNPVAIEFVKAVLPGATTIGPFEESHEGNPVIDAFGSRIGSVIQTAPASDNIIGYSGPTNCLIALDAGNRIRSVTILNSGDTIEHVNLVKKNRRFQSSFEGLGFETKNQWANMDGVAGATLTSYSVIAGVASRMNGTEPSLKFANQPDQKNVSRLFPLATEIESTKRDSIWNVLDRNKNPIGFVLSTSPVADRLSGYQGPTATLAGFDIDQKCVGVVVDQTYENEPYASYLDNDRPFQKLYAGQSLEEIAAMDPEKLGIEGVSGATMTSMSVAEGLPLAATAALEVSKSTATWDGSTRSPFSYLADVITVLLTLLGVAFSYSGMRHQKRFRIGYQVAVILLLGFTSGHMLSQASIAGWSAHSIPWTVAPGLVFLAMAALSVPIISKHQPYCQHICPFGAMQQLGRKAKFANRIGWKLKNPASLRRVFQWIPFVLLVLVVIAAVSRSSFNLASLEPFDGFGYRVAGWATILIFVFGLIASLVSPMAYCRFGCPTGAMISFLRFRADSNRLGLRDLAAVALAVIAAMILAMR